MTVSRNVQRGNRLEAGIGIADGVLETQFVHWREICRVHTNFAMPTSYMRDIPLPTQAQFPDMANFTAKAGNQADTSDEYDSNYTVSNVKVVAVDPQLNALVDATSTPPPIIGMSPDTQIYNYVASADVTMPALKGNVVARLRRVFQKKQQSPWNWAIFYADPLEIHPGPAFTVTGPVHTNSDLFTGHNTLTFADKVTFARDWTVGFMPGDTTHPETPTPPISPPGLPPALDIAQQPFGLDANRIFNDPSNPNETNKYHELVEEKVAGYTDPLAGGRYVDQACIQFYIDGANSIRIVLRDGTVVNTSSTMYSTLAGTITTNQTIQDNRELASIRLATLDVSKLVTALNAPGNTVGLAGLNWNGIVYIKDTSNTTGTRRGIRIKNASVVPTNGLTIASANPVYVQGDFNTGSNPPSNSGDPTKPQGTGYTRQPCSILADAVNILSNTWNDANSLAGISSRVAANTTVNAALVSGIVPTGGGNYSGGVENFPRFLEDWTGKTLTYYGSMVQLYPSDQSKGTWGKANVYGAPLRRWYFDNNFKLAAPPGSLMIFSYIKGKWSVL